MTGAAPFPDAGNWFVQTWDAELCHWTQDGKQAACGMMIFGSAIRENPSMYSPRFCPTCSAAQETRWPTIEDFRLRHYMQISEQAQVGDEMAALTLNHLQYELRERRSRWLQRVAP